MHTQSNRLWITVLLLGWLFNLVFWKHTPGVSFAVFVLILLAAGLALLWQAGIRPSKWALVLLLPILFFAAATFVRAEPLSLFFAYAFSLALMAVLTITFQGGRWASYGIPDYVAKSLDLFASSIVRPIMFAVEVEQLKRKTDPVEKSSSPFWPILRGLLLAIPVLAFFIVLFSSADPIFAGRVQGLVGLFQFQHLPEYIFRIIYIAAVAYLLAGIYLHAAYRSKDETLFGSEKPLLAPFLGFTEAAVVMGSVNLLFALFVVLQFQYFFGGQANIQIAGYTYAEYLHKGFGELVVVAFSALLLFLGLSSVVKRDSVLRRRLFSWLGVLLFSLVALILVSAYQRLILYESAYGFTRLRTYIHVFMIWVAVLLAAVVVLDLLQRQRAFALAGLLASLGFAASLLVMNVDAFIVQQNIQRSAQGQDLDVAYLASLSSDATLPLVGLYQAQGLDTGTHDRLGAVLACIRAQNASTTAQDASWQSFQLSAYWSDLALRSVQTGLKGYTVDESNWPHTVKTPLGQSYPCEVDVMD